MSTNHEAHQYVSFSSLIFFLPNFRSPRSCVSASHWRSADARVAFPGTVIAMSDSVAHCFVHVRHCVMKLSDEVLVLMLILFVCLFVCGWVIVAHKNDNTEGR